MRVCVSLTAGMAAVLVVSGCAAPKVTTQTLLAEMTDLAGLAEYPDPPFTCKQFSSYDRRSVTPDDPEGWFANGDAGKHLRVEERAGRKEYVMMDAAGPGAIVRIWSANPRGTLYFYLDGSEEPTLELPMSDLLRGEYPGIPKPIAGERSRGCNSYFPIPYAQHCKVTGDEILTQDESGRWHSVYYHINYRTYPAGTEVVSFESEDLESLVPSVEWVTDVMNTPSLALTLPDKERVLVIKGRRHTDWHVIPSGESYEWTAQSGRPGAIRALYVEADSADLDAALRRLLLTMEFDGEQTVACPLGDFFGAAPGINPYTSLPLSVSAEGRMWCQWVMPFEKSARLRIENRGSQLAQVRVYVGGGDHKWTDRSMHFHAKWRGEFDVPTRPMQDWNYLAATGQGVFVGAAFNIANPVRQWWGEGDEKIYVDGETFPSHFGTGTEDYYGYAWCCNEPFTHAYHNQPRCDGPDNYGHTAVNRWHIIDRIPFEQDFRFDMELWHWHETAKVDMSVVAYWYARPGATDGFPPIDEADLRVPVIAPYVAPRVEGALEGEEMSVLEVTGGSHEVQGWGGLSNEKHLWWRHGQPGDKLVLGFEVEQAGAYRVIARFLTAGDYGIHQLYVNDEPVAETIDLYNDGVKASEERELGVFSLTAGQNKLTAEVVGANEKAVKSHMLGLDYLRLVPAED